MASCRQKLDTFMELTNSGFEKYGRFVTRHPILFIILPITVCGLLGIGLYQMSSESDLETLYVPINSQSAADRSTAGILFPDKSDSNFYIQSLTRINMYGEILIKVKDNTDILSTDIITEIHNMTSQIRQFSFNDDGSVVHYSDVCAIRNDGCYVTGDRFIETTFLESYRAGNVTYPTWKDPRGIPVDLAESMKGEVDEQGILKSVSVLRLVFNLRQTNTGRSSMWEKTFVTKMATIFTSLTEVAYSTSTSLDDELDSNTGQDITWFSLSFTLLITYASFVASSGNCIANRGHLARGGVIGVGLAILAAFGLLSAVGLKFVNIVGVMPFVALGVGVDTMFVIMSEWAEHYNEETVEDQMGVTLRKCGGSITIASLTNITAFFIGMSSRFISIRNFCAYTGLALAFSFLCHMTFFLGCLTIHGRRVRAKRHCLTCMVVSETERHSNRLCKGNSPGKREDDESLCERLPRKILSATLFLNIGVKIFIVVLFCVYLGVSIWGVTNLKQGLVLGNLVSEDSYFYNYEKWKTEDFKTIFSISFNFENMDYLDSDQISSMTNLLESVEKEPTMSANSLICWYHQYKQSNYFDNTNTVSFMTNLTTFLQYRPYLSNDVVFSSDGLSINASRCHLITRDIPDSTDQGNLMLRMRELADSSKLDVFAYSPPFIFFEQYVIILPSTLQTVGIAVVCMLIITIIFMPHPIMVLLVTLNMISILVGIFGFLYFWDLTLSSITMIHLIMSVGFSVDFSVHVCHGFISSEGETRTARAMDALRVSAAPVINGGLSSLLGICTLLGSTSYVFRSFFKIMVLVICFGLAHSMLLLPVILSLIGPRKTDKNIVPIKPVTPENKVGPCKDKNQATLCEQDVNKADQNKDRNQGDVNKADQPVNVTNIQTRIVKSDNDQTCVVYSNTQI